MLGGEHTGPSWPPHSVCWVVPFAWEQEPPLQPYTQREVAGSGQVACGPESVQSGSEGDGGPWFPRSPRPSPPSALRSEWELTPAPEDPQPPPSCWSRAPCSSVSRSRSAALFTALQNLY